MTAIAPYRSPEPPPRERLARLVHAEWTKFRTVRGWVIAIVLAPVLSVALAVLPFLGHTPACHQDGRIVACPPPAALPTGPGGEGVIDRFSFVHQPLTGNGTITVRLTSLTGEYSADGAALTPSGTGETPGVQPWSKAGIMISAGTAPGSAYAAMLATGGNGVRMQWNYTGDTAGLPGAVSASSPRWLRLVRSGSTVTGYDSADGTHWAQVSSVTLSGLPGTVQAGLFATSPSYQSVTSSLGATSGSAEASLATGTFDNVVLDWPGAGGSWTRTSVGQGNGTEGAPLVTGPAAGSYTHAGGTFTVTGSGDIAPSVPGDPDSAGADPEELLSTVVVGLVMMIVVAALFITAEYRRRMIAVTFAASPRRGRVIAAKSVVIGAVTFVAGAVGAVAALLLGAHFARSAGSLMLPDPVLTRIRMIVGAGAMLAVCAVLALALGALVRRGIAAITVVIVVVFVPFMLATIQDLLPLGMEEWLLRVTPAAAFAVVQDIPAYHQVIAQYTPAGGYFPLPWWAGFAVLCAWAAAALAAAACALRRRDA